MLTAKCGIAGVFLTLFLIILGIATQTIFYFECALWSGLYCLVCTAGVILETIYTNHRKPW
jgi:hypothetical protein